MKILLVLFLALCWQPLYLLARVIYHTAKGDIYDKSSYWSAFKDWFNKLFSLVFVTPGV